MTNKPIPLSVAIEQARANIINSVNKVIAESKLPAYLLEGIFLELLADVRESKIREISSELLKLASDEVKEEQNVGKNS